MAHTLRARSTPYWLTALAALLLCVPVGCRKKEASKGPSAEASRVVVTVGPVRVQAVQRTVEVVGTLFGDEESTISAKVAGRVTEVLHDVGDRIAPGEPLARVDDTDYRLSVEQREAALSATLAEIGLDTLPKEAGSGEGEFDPERVPTVARARLELSNAEAKYGRAKAMHDERPPLISEQDYADQLTAFEVAKSTHAVALLTARSLLAQAKTRASELEQSRQAHADTTVRAPGSIPAASGGAAPFAVAARFVSPGEYIREGTAMFRLVDADPIKFRADVPERHLAEIRVGQEVDVSVQAFEVPFKGRVARVSPQVNANNRTFQIEIHIDNADGRLTPGGFARGSIKTRQEENILFVPQEAVVTFIGITKVFAIKDGKAAEHRVSTGVQDGQYLEVTATGLVAGDQVAITGVSRLADGVPVEVKSQDALTAPVIDPDAKVTSSKTDAARPLGTQDRGGDK